MKKFFDIKALKSGEDCKKFSKSVSYETLVGGTATTDTDIKQTQWLSKGSANKPLTAVGTLTSLLCNSAKVVENILQISPVLRLVKVLGLVAVLSFTIIAESSAECVGATETTAGTDNITGAHCGICGTNCNWKIDGDTLTITGNGKMTDYNTNNWAPWRHAENFAQVKNVVIDGLTSVGSYAFYDARITKLTMSDTVTNIEGKAFAWTDLSEVKLSDSLKKLAGGAFRHTSLSEFILPYDVSIGIDALGSKQPTIICKGSTDECAILHNLLENYKYTEYQEPFSSVSLPLGNKVQTIGELDCESTNYYWSGTSCNNKKNGIKCAENYSLDDDNKCIICNKQGYKDVGGYCNRIRYTPAEAAQVLTDDNNNSVTITFKK